MKKRYPQLGRPYKVLLVGAGGIGCEVLKNLVISGFNDIELVDLDTIDISNLNRQFLFNSSHVGKPKSIVAAETVLKFNSDVKITAHHANIKDKQFSLRWFKTFDLCINALDNLAARRYVNRMCLMVNLPLIESGTAGYQGQTSVILKGITECFDCTGKPEEGKTFPVCTIRSYPTQPIHCIVWAKSILFNNLFGEIDKEDFESTDSTDSSNLDLTQSIQKIIVSLRTQYANPQKVAESIVHEVFVKDIVRIGQLEDVWKNRTKPEPLNLKELETLCVSGPSGLGIDSDLAQIKPSVGESYRLLYDSCTELCKRLLILRKTDPEALLVFDKDDDHVLNFVAAAANLRAFVYKIDPTSVFDSKAMAGNIIPAIATTNAIVAATIVIQAKNIAKGNLNSCLNSYLANGSNRRQLIIPENTNGPNLKCSVCQYIPQVINLDLNLAFNTFINIVCELIFQRLGNKISDLSTDDIKSSVTIVENQRELYSPDSDEVPTQTLNEMGIAYGCTLQLSFDYDEIRQISIYIDEDGIALDDLEVQFVTLRRGADDLSNDNSADNGNIEMPDSKIRDITNIYQVDGDGDIVIEGFSDDVVVV